MKRFLILLVMSLSMLVVSAPSCAEEQELAKPVTGTKCEYVEKALSTQVDSVNKKIAHDNCIILLTSEVEKYIQSRIGRKIDVHDISSHIVKESLDNDIDICFVLAQAEIETLFGTKGIGRSRKSMYGVYITYKTHNKSTTYYIKLIKDKYLGSKKTVHHLMRNFVSLSGHRYSSNKNYESDLKGKYKEIEKSTKIKKLQDECNKYDI